MSFSRSGAPTSATAPAPPLGPDLPWLTALALAACWAFFKINGSSPRVWVDTLVDNELIERCVELGRCTTVGVGATVGIFHTVGYLNLRAALDWLGFDPNHTHQALLTFNALGTVLVALTARRLGGLPSAALAAVLYATFVSGNTMQTDVVSDVAPMPFLGCAFLLVCSAARDRPGYAGSIGMGLVAAVVANCYATGFACAVSAVALALCAPERPLRHALITAVTFAAAAFLIAPGTFIVDAQVFLSDQHVGSGQRHGGRSLGDVPILWRASLACAIWLGAAWLAPALRRAMDVPFAVFAPVYLPFLLGGLLGKLEPQDKYFCNAAAAIAVALAVGLVGMARAGWQRVARQPDGRLAHRFVALSPYAAVLGLLALTRWQLTDPRLFTYRELSRVVHVLAADNGWAWTTALRNLRTPDDMVRQSTLRWARGWREREPRGPHSPGALDVAHLFKARTRELPARLPASTTVVEQRGDQSTLLAVSCSWIDWRAFSVCDAEPDGRDERCTTSGFSERYETRLEMGLPGMPVADPRKDRAFRRMRLHIPLHARASCPRTMIHMPLHAFACPGRIVSVDGNRAGVDADQRSVTLERDAVTGDAPSELVLEWKLGGPECNVQYRGYPPYFLDGDPDTVTMLMPHHNAWAVPRGYVP